MKKLIRFSQFFLVGFQAYFMHKSFRKWAWFWLFEFFYKNEAFNQKSETVKLLGYGWTCYHDSSGLRKLILRMPRPYSDAHANAGSDGIWSSYTKVASGSQEVDSKKVAQNACINSKWCFEHSRGVTKWFGIDFELIESIWSIFMKIYFQRHLMVFVGICTLISGISRVMSPSVLINTIRSLKTPSQCQVV